MAVTCQPGFHLLQTDLCAACADVSLEGIPLFSPERSVPVSCKYPDLYQPEAANWCTPPCQARYIRRCVAFHHNHWSFIHLPLIELCQSEIVSQILEREEESWQRKVILLFPTLCVFRLWDISFNRCYRISCAMSFNVFISQNTWKASTHFPSTFSSNWVLVYKSLSTHWRSFRSFCLHQRHHNIIICPTYSMKRRSGSFSARQSDFNFDFIPNTPELGRSRWTPPGYCSGISYTIAATKNKLWISICRLIASVLCLSFRFKGNMAGLFLSGRIQILPVAAAWPSSPLCCLFSMYANLSFAVLINVFVLVLQNKLLMTKLLGNWDSLFPLEPLGCNIGCLLRTKESSGVKVCILMTHYYPSLHLGFCKEPY